MFLMKLDYTKVAVFTFQRPCYVQNRIKRKKKKELSLAKGAIHVNDLGSWFLSLLPAAMDGLSWKTHESPGGTPNPGYILWNDKSSGG